MAKWVWGVLIGASLSYFLYCPLPNGIAQPMRLRMYHAFDQIMSVYVTGATFLGLTDEFSALDSMWAVKNWVLRCGLDEEPTIKHSDTTFDGVGVRLYEPVEKSAKPVPGIVYIHGGGWIVGSTDIYHSVTKYIAARLGIVVVSVEYRMAPQYPFPIPLEDCVKATVWFLQHAGEYGVNPTRVAVMGDSAGGNLAAAVPQMLTFEEKYKLLNLPELKFQGLVYPALQAVDFLTPSYQQHYVALTAEFMTLFWSMYMNGRVDHMEAMMVNNHTSPQFKKSHQKLLDHSLIPNQFKGGKYQSPENQNFGNVEIFSKIQDTLMNPYFAPLMRSDLSGLPPAYILTAGFDVLRDDGIMYAKRLEETNISVTWKHYEEGFHGIFCQIGSLGFEVGQQCMDDFIEYSRSRL
ncbi:arylacetamide deacetylase-like [Glandiceps talaboti]